MRTIVEPEEKIAKLWGKQQIKHTDTYRLMRYVMRVDHEGNVLLYNVITSQLAVLEGEEVDIINSLPVKYIPGMEQLVDNHFLVPESYDEHQQVVNMRCIFRKLEEAQVSKDITKYTILPTTACNARCYYCFEQGAKTTKMSKEIADSVVEFIASHCGEKKFVRITWFGGEPTVASDRIDQITEGLRLRGIKYLSQMVTNGYLFDEGLVQKAKEKWNLEYLQICFDGLEERHNATKSFVNVRDNPYQRILRNIGLLLDSGIRVGMRMNFDKANYQDFGGLVKEAKLRFGDNPNLSVYAFPVIGEYADKEGNVLHGSEEWFIDKIVELNNMSREAGLYHSVKQLPHFRYHCCDAENDSTVTITPDGSLVRCCERFDDTETTGTVTEGITDENRAGAWKISADHPKCRDCTFFPDCYRIEKCPAKDRCLFLPESYRKYTDTIISLFSSGKNLSNKKEDDCNVF
ncbi:radical SAM additional 4Fe4S-binding SPASM domain-containing protein [Aristaeella hokkaidonensis]|nr:radical SAM additional 4Fe4S-binding SPASM domain-containing protein [Aristaeella hokkaidonensis]